MKETKEIQNMYIKLLKLLTNFENGDSLDFNKIELLIFFTNIRNFSYFYQLNEGKIISKEKYFGQFGRPFSARIVKKKILAKEYQFENKQIYTLVKKLSKTKYGTGNYSIIYKELRMLGYSVADSSEHEARILQIKRVIEEYLIDMKKDTIYSSDIDNLVEITHENRSLIYRLIKKFEFKYIVGKEGLISLKANKLIEKEKKEKWFKDNNFKQIYDNVYLNEKGESWKYKVHSMQWGRVKNSLRTNNYGMQIYTCRINGQLFSVHKLVAIHYIPNPNNYKHVRAIDGNYLNIKLSNLEWVKYTASVRVIKGLVNKSDLWLNIIIKHFKPGMHMTELVTAVTSSERQSHKYSSNVAKRNTISTIIKNYSSGNNELFPIFNIDKEKDNLLTINSDVLKKLQKNKMV